MKEVKREPKTVVEMFELLKGKDINIQTATLMYSLGVLDGEKGTRAS